MPYKDKERSKEYQKQYHKEYKKRYHEDNKERIKEYKKRYYEDNKERIHDYRLKSKFGITREQHKQMFISQNGRCAICNIEFKTVGKRKVHVDHNHTTDQVRQLLCESCNHMIGLAKENTTTLLNAVEYLNKWNN